MAREAVPTLQSLEKPEDLKTVLKQDMAEDCTACRVVGGSAFLGLAAFNYFSGHAQLEARRQAVLNSNSMFGMRSRRLGITMLSLGLAWMGVWRLVK
ncbi:hypothetical protein jhhlp_006113 [Lomentospora prolificans]|uniref:Distal membrane-arm assembly complex protein 1-like domain-containing protein n=1 Tax=Lomentospora prolificans TaxID=41688 RepID=A0A2N3N4Z7_9PEZI|nr:hypothetical protein jhhlp_006113 [Lomentospora prolificans]